MNDDPILKFLAIVTFSVTATIAGCSGAINYQDNAAMVEMVSKGADPQDARCAVKGATNQGECVIRATIKREK